MIFIYLIKKDEQTKVNCGSFVIIKLRHNRALTIHKFKSYNIIKNIHDFGQTLSTFVNIYEWLKI